MRLVPAALVAASLLACPISAASPPPHTDRTAETERNRAIVADFFDLLMVRRKVREAYEKYVATDYIQHNPVAADGRENAIAALEPMFRAMPQLSYDVRRIIADGDLVAVHALSKPTPDARGYAAVDILRLKDGKIVEHWDVVQPMPEKSANPHPMF